jgi:hypothetical protein
MDRSGLEYRGLLIGRGCYLGALWGAGYGGVTYLVLCLATVSTGGLLAIFLVQFACCIGGVIGAASGLAGGLALALSGPRVTGRQLRARLVAGAAAAAVPLAVAGYLHGAGPSLYTSARLWVAAVTAVAAATAALLTPRILSAPSPPRYVELPMPAEVRVITPVRAAADHGDDHVWAEPSAVQPFRRWLIIGRGLGWGIISGTALGAFSWTVLSLETGQLRTMMFVGIPAAVGALLGGCLGLAAGTALALSGRRVAERMYQAQLVAGGVVTAIPLALVYLNRPRSLWAYAYLLSPVNLAVVAALTAVLLTPRILLGAPERRDWQATSPDVGP